MMMVCAFLLLYDSGLLRGCISRCCNWKLAHKQLLLRRHGKTRYGSEKTHFDSTVRTDLENVRILEFHGSSKCSREIGSVAYFWYVLVYSDSSHCTFGCLESLCNSYFEDGNPEIIQDMQKIRYTTTDG